MPKENLAFALDFPTFREAKPVLTSLTHVAGFAKVGLELFTREGPTAVQGAIDAGFSVFLDLKLHDIPATVERAVANAARLGVTLLTVHASGGSTMLQRAVKAAHDSSDHLRIVAITVLTSLDASDLKATGVEALPARQTSRLAQVAWNAGVRTFVCSPREARRLRAELGSSATLITPGIRPEGAPNQDQKRVATPASAIADGADLLVVGRPIREASDPTAAARAILDQIDAALAKRRKA